MSLIKIWKNKGKILEGLKNKIFKDEHVEEIFQERRDICKECPNLNLAGDKCAVPGTAPCCGVCGCSLDLLLRSLSSECEDGRWDAILSEDEENELHKTLKDGE
jgi:hypothetical protein